MRHRGRPRSRVAADRPRDRRGLRRLGVLQARAAAARSAPSSSGSSATPTTPPAPSIPLSWPAPSARTPPPRSPPRARSSQRPHPRRQTPESSGPTPLPAGGTVTVEPGGPGGDRQPAAAERRRPRCAAVRADADADPRRGSPPRAWSCSRGRATRCARRAGSSTSRATPAMEASFDRIGPHGRTMMCSTSAVQVCVDAGEGADVAQRWAALHELGPVLLAAFANSPVVHGRRTGWKSSRMASWLALDPERTRPPRHRGRRPGPRVRAAGARHASCCACAATAPAGCPGRCPTVHVRRVDRRRARHRRPPVADLDYHLTTLFPPVRPQGHLEVRYIDQQAGDEWVVPLAVVAALMHDPGHGGPGPRRGRARRRPLDRRRPPRARRPRPAPGRGRGVRAGAPHPAPGPRSPTSTPRVRELVDHVISERVLRGRCPADEPLDEPARGPTCPPAADPPPFPPDDLDPSPGDPDPPRR